MLTHYILHLGGQKYANIHHRNIFFDALYISKIFHSYGKVTITGEGLQILTYARHLWPLSSEGSLACHTYCDTGHPCLMAFSEDP